MKPHVKYGLYVGLAFAAIFIVTTYIPDDRKWILSYSSMFVLAFSIYFAIKETRDAKVFINYNRGLGIGTLTALIAGIVDGFISYFFCKFFNHQYIENARVSALDMLENSKSFHYTSEQMSMIKQMLPMSVSPGTQFFAAVIWTTFIGFLISLFIASILKKPAPPADMQSF